MGSGNKPPAMQAANKGAWLPQDLARASAHFGVPMLPSPSNFFSEVARKVIKCQRLLCAAQALCDPATVEGLVTSLTDAIHSDASFRDADNNLAIDEAFLRACCEKVPTVRDVDALLAAAAGADAKAALRATTDEAVERGAFGSPSMVIDMTGNAEVNPAGDDGDGNPFFIFGSDRFEQMAFTAGRRWDGPNPDAAGRSKL